MTTSSKMELTFREVTAEEIPAAFALEVAGFPSDEAATLPTLIYRQSVAPSLFFGAYLPNTSQLVGFICALLTPESTLSHEAMTNHVPNSAFVGIHSVCVDNQFRRKGVAVALLKAYTHRLVAEGYEGVRLISHKELIGLYEKAGFELVGLSSVVHGPEPWFELKIDFEISEKVEEKETSVEVVPVIEERNPGKPFGSFTGMEELLTTKSMNAGNLYCPRGECRCLLLKAGAGKWVRGDSNDFELPSLPQPINSPTQSSPSLGYWSIPSPLSFENIGFSRNALPTNSTNSSSTSSIPVIANIKYLVCADCDHGPLGWHDTEGRDLGLEVEVENEGKGGELRKGREFLLDVGRVRYKI